MHNYLSGIPDHIRQRCVVPTLIEHSHNKIDMPSTKTDDNAINYDDTDSDV